MNIKKLLIYFIFLIFISCSTTQVSNNKSQNIIFTTLEKYYNYEWGTLINIIQSIEGKPSSERTQYENIFSITYYINKIENIRYEFYENKLHLIEYYYSGPKHQTGFTSDDWIDLYILLYDRLNINYGNNYTAINSIEEYNKLKEKVKQKYYETIGNLKPYYFFDKGISYHGFTSDKIHEMLWNYQDSIIQIQFITIWNMEYFNISIVYKSIEYENNMRQIRRTSSIQ